MPRHQLKQKENEAAIIPRKAIRAPRTEFGKHIIEETHEYVETYKELGQELPTLSGLALFIGIEDKTLYRWLDKHQSFRQAVSQIKQFQHVDLLNGGLSNRYNANITKLILTNHHGYVDGSQSNQGFTVNVSINRDNDVAIDGEVIDNPTDD